MKDLIQYISSIVEGLEKQKKLQFENFDDNLWLLFSGDKGGKHMKFYFEVSVVATLALSTITTFSLCMKVQILIETWL